MSVLEQDVSDQVHDVPVAGVRNGLMQAESVLLEPFYEFTLILDRQYIGRAMTDFERMGHIHYNR